MIAMLENLPLSKLNEIPDGFNNNIIWNITHVVAVQEAITYSLSGLRWTIPTKIVKGYARGTAPAEAVDAAFVAFLTEELFLSIDRLETNYKEGLFQKYNEYELSLGYKLRSIEDAIYFDIYHEALHMGAITNMKKFLF